MMKSFLRVLFPAFALTFVSFIAHAAPQSYPLVCLGGGGTLGYNSGIALMYFTKAPGPAGMGLSPGQCSWVDRAIGQTEPTCVRQDNVSAAAWIFPGVQRANSYFSSTQAPWLRDLLDGAKFQTFQVYNGGEGNCFVVTRLGP